MARIYAAFPVLCMTVMVGVYRFVAFSDQPLQIMRHPQPQPYAATKNETLRHNVGDQEATKGIELPDYAIERRDKENQTEGGLNWTNRNKTDGTCNAHDRLVFIKTHKTGGTTMQNIVQIYGYYHNKSFVFNKGDKRTGHIRYIKVDQSKILPPLNVARGDYEKYTNNFDMAAGHLKYNRTFLDTVMKNNTKYVSILRDPVHQFESAFVFFGHAKKKKLSIEAQISNWLDAPRGDTGYINNNQILDLGLLKKDFRNSSAVATYIDKLEREFDLMFITEYFDESLLLLRKLMCWSFEDISYIKQNARPTKSRANSLSKRVKNKIRKWNVADLRLYEHFNKSLWNQIAEYGPHFQRDLQYFKEKQDHIFNTCVESGPNQIAQHSLSKKKIKYNVTQNATEYCVFKVGKDKDVFKRLWQRQQQ